MVLTRPAKHAASCRVLRTDAALGAARLRLSEEARSEPGEQMAIHEMFKISETCTLRLLPDRIFLIKVEF